MLTALTVNTKIPMKSHTIIMKIKFYNFCIGLKSPHIGRTPSKDPTMKKKPKINYSKHTPRLKKVESNPISDGMDNIHLKMPLTHTTPYLMDIPKVNRHKSPKNTPEILANKTLPKVQIKKNEDLNEIPETLFDNKLTPDTPTSKVKISTIEKKK